MAGNFERVKDLFILNERVFTLLGTWPLQSGYVKFTMWFVYLLIHITLELADLFYVFGNLELTVLNLMESVPYIMALVKMMVMRFSQTLVGLTRRVIDGTDAKHFESTEEMEIYLNYNRIAKTFFKLCLAIGITTELAFNLQPLEFRLKAVLRNESMPFVLSYRTRLFFEVTESSTFWLLWIYQCLMTCISMFHSATIGYLFTLVLHASGQLSILAFRIKNLDLDPRDSHESFRSIFRVIANKHHNIIEIVKDINDVFGLVLLEELIISTVIIGITCYSALENVDFEQTGELISYMMYVFLMILLMYGYCIAGEYLIVESTNLYEAYYQCRWYVMSNSFKKQMIICMLGAQKPIQLNAGGFYIFSLISFTSILKTSAGYISLLRTII